MSTNDDLFVIGGPAPQQPQGKPPRRMVIGGVVAVIGIALAVGGFFLGRTTAPSGPSTLADAVARATSGKLPCGTSSNGAAQFLTRLCSAGGFGGRFGRGGAAGGANGGAGGGANGGQNGAGRFGGGAGFTGAGAVNGTVASVSGNSMTITTRAGQLTITLGSNVQVRTTTTAARSAIAKGAGVSVTTTTDSKGNRVASRVIVLPAN